MAMYRKRKLIMKVVDERVILGSLEGLNAETR